MVIFFFISGHSRYPRCVFILTHLTIRKHPSRVVWCVKQGSYISKKRVPSCSNNPAQRFKLWNLNPHLHLCAAVWWVILWNNPPGELKECTWSSETRVDKIFSGLLAPLSCRWTDFTVKLHKYARGSLFHPASPLPAALLSSRLHLQILTWI